MKVLYETRAAACTHTHTHTLTHTHTHLRKFCHVRTCCLHSAWVQAMCTHTHTHRHTHTHTHTQCLTHLCACSFELHHPSGPYRLFQFTAPQPRGEPSGPWEWTHTHTHTHAHILHECTCENRNEMWVTQQCKTLVLVPLCVYVCRSSVRLCVSVCQHTE